MSTDYPLPPIVGQTDLAVNNNEGELSRLRSPQVVCDKGFDAGLKMPFPATRGFFCGLLRPGGHFLGFFDHA